MIKYQASQGRNRVILRGGRRYIYFGKEKIIHDLSQVQNVLRL